MAGAVADAQEDWFVLAACFRQRLRSPWVPVDGVVGMFQQVRTCLLRQAIGHCITLPAILQTDGAMGQMDYRAETDAL